MTAGTIDAGRVDGEFYGLLASMNVKSLVFYPKKAWDAAGYEVPESLERARRPDRGDQGRRHDAVVHGHRVRDRHRLAGDGLVRGPRHALRRRRRLQLVGQPRDPVRLRPGPRGRGLLRGAPLHRGQRGRRPRVDRQHELRHRRRTRCSTTRPAACCSSRAASSPRSSRRTSRPTCLARSACSASRRPRPAARTRCSAVATSPCC